MENKNIINVTPHDVTMLFCKKLENGECKGFGCNVCYEDYEIKNIPPSGITISAKVVEKHYKEKHGVELVTTSFEPNDESKKELKKIEEDFWGDCIIVGSIIAAQAFPERVYAMVPAPGFKRVPPEEKIVRSDKFTVFKKEGR